MNTRPIFPILFLFAFFQLGLTEAFSQDNKEPFRTERFSISEGTTLETELSGSSIAIERGNVSEMVVHMFLKKNGEYFLESDSETQDFLEDFDVDVHQSGKTVTISAKPKSNFNFSWGSKPSLSFLVITPGDLDTHIRTSGGSVSLQQINGTHDLASSGGSIRVADSKGEVISKSSGGSISLTDFVGQVDVRTSGGSIKIEGLEGDLIASTSGGGMSLSHISGSIDASSSGGSIKASLDRVDGDMNFKSSGGSIQVALTDNAKFDIEVRGGGIRSDLDHFNGTITKDKISGSVNGGGPAISMQSSGGSIRVSNTD